MRDEPLPYPDPPLSDGRIGLRRWRVDDVECIRLASTDPDITTGTTVPADFTETEGVAFIHRQWSRVHHGEGVSQAIVDARRDRAIGLMWVARRPQTHVGGLGYWVVPAARRQRVATAAVRLVVPWAFSALELRRLEAWVHPANMSSQGVLRGAGFAQEGRIRDFFSTETEVADALVFSTIAPPQVTPAR